MSVTRDALAAMTPEGRVFLARIGRRFGTREVLRQARSTVTTCTARLRYPSTGLFCRSVM